jgi:hypothetical protein
VAFRLPVGQKYPGVLVQGAQATSPVVFPQVPKGQGSQAVFPAAAWLPGQQGVHTLPLDKLNTQPRVVQLARPLPPAQVALKGQAIPVGSWEPGGQKLPGGAAQGPVHSGESELEVRADPCRCIPPRKRPFLSAGSPNLPPGQAMHWEKGTEEEK